MPTFKITGPDGKSYRVSGENAEGAFQALQQHLGASTQPAEPESQQSQELRGQLSSMTQDPETIKFDIPYGAGMNWTDAATGGLAGKASSALTAAIRAPFTDNTFGEEYEDVHNSVKAARKRYQQENPKSAVATGIGGGVIGGGQLMNAVGNLAGRIAPQVAARLNQGLAGRTATDVLGGAGFGALSGYGYDEGAGQGALIGGALGAVTRPLMAAGGAAINSAAGLVGLGNQGRAQSAIADAVARSGRTVNEISDDLARAAQDGQPEYMVADAMGNAGQRMLTGVARSPGDMRQQIADRLTGRQAGQGRRLQNALVEGFGAPQTAKQTEAALEALRKADAGVNYPAAKQAAGSVDPTGAIARADEFLGTSGSLPRTNIADDSVEGVVRRARSFLTDGDNIVSDFDTAFRAKIELDSMIENGNPTIKGRLIPIRNELDKALEKSSDLYANARDTFRRQSQDIEAANIGRDAAMRGRVEDTIPQFQAMSRPEQHASFRAGYVDPYIADIQKAPGLMTNKARPLTSDAVAAEFPAFAAPGKGPQLMDRISREQRMFETANSALGGSRTAENLSDIADIGGFDPTMIGALATGNIKSAAIQALTRSASALQGRNTQTRDLIAQALMQSSPTRANEQLLSAVRRGDNLQQLQQRLVQALIGGTIATQAAN